MTTKNCDGCARGLPIVNWIHRGSSVEDLQTCTAYRYVESAIGRFSHESVAIQKINRMADAALLDLAKVNTPHPFEHGPRESCDLCARPFGADIHNAPRPNQSDPSKK